MTNICLLGLGMVYLKPHSHGILIIDHYRMSSVTDILSLKLILTKSLREREIFEIINQASLTWGEGGRGIIIVFDHRLSSVKDIFH